MLKNYRRPDLKTLLRYPDLLVLSIGVTLFFAYFFYHSVIAIPFMLPIGYLFLLDKQKERRKKEQFQLTLSFQDFLDSLIANLQSGYSVENAIFEIRKELVMLSGEKSAMIKYVDEIIKGIRNQIPVETLFYQFGEKSGVEEIMDFAAVFAIAKRTGGDMTTIIKNSTNLIHEKAVIKNEIYTILGAKEYEANLMTLIPFGIFGYISIMTPGYFSCLYGNPMGIIVMTICLVFYIIAYAMIKKIMDTE